MATTIQDVDIRLVLDRLRPDSEYGWFPDGDSFENPDFGHTLGAVAWRDPNTAKPSEAEVIAEWEAYLQERAVQEEAEQERQQKLDTLRSARNADLDPADYSGEDALIQTLAERIAWLEQEVLDLRGGQV